MATMKNKALAEKIRRQIDALYLKEADALKIAQGHELTREQLCMLDDAYSAMLMTTEAL